MGRRYVQGRKLFWASLALLLVFVVLPACLGLAYWWNEQVAGSDAIAYNMNSDADLIAQPTENPTLYRIAAFIDDGTLHQAEQSVFWQVNNSWNEMIVQTGATTTTDNASSSNRLYFNWNITAQELLNQNINKIVISLKGVNANTTIRYSIRAINNGYIFSDSSNGVNLLDITNFYAYKTISLNNTTAITITIPLDPAVLKYAADHTSANNSHITISLSSYDPTKEFFTEGQVIYFKIYATHPHGNIVIGNSYDFMTTVIWIFTGFGIFVLLVTSPAWNPTTRDGLIDHLINRAKYAHSRGKHRKKSRKKSHKRRR